jgi:glucosamine kinase
VSDAPTLLAGVDGGGTRSTLVLASLDGEEIARVSGPAGLVDPRAPERTAGMIAELLRMARDRAGVEGRPAALCAGLAGVGNEAERTAVQRALERASVATAAIVVTDGEIALEGAFGGGAGVLLVAGTGSVAYGRGPDGRIERCGGWGMVVGDEGSGYAIGREAVARALRSVDGREQRTELLPRLLELLRLDGPRALPPWAGRASKAKLASLARLVLETAAAGDAVARSVVEAQAEALASHVVALAHRLRPWPEEVPVVLHGGVLRSGLYASLVDLALRQTVLSYRIQRPLADAVQGALSCARALLAEGVRAAR